MQARETVLYTAASLDPWGIQSKYDQDDCVESANAALQLYFTSNSISHFRNTKQLRTTKLLSKKSERAQENFNSVIFWFCLPNQNA